MMKNKMTRILSLVIVLSMIFTTVAFAAPKHKQFEHYNKKYELKSEDYENALKSLINKEIVKGYGNGDYGLSGNVKRGDVIVMIIRMLEKSGKLDLDDYDDIKEAFEDVYESDYFYDSINKAKKLGIAKGDGEFFKPNKPVSVQEAIWLVARAADSLGLEIDEDSMIKDLEEIYEGELDKFAKRRDVFWMIYFVLGEVEFDEDDQDEVVKFNDIKLTMKDGNQLDFSDSWFVRAYNAKITDKNKDELEYVKFNLPKNGGTLYYEYDEDVRKNTLISEKTKYYLGDDEDYIIENISFVPEKYFKGTVTIGYTAYTEEDSYTGLIKITVDYETFKPINYKVLENEYVTFVRTDFNDLIEEVKFEIPNDKVGTLYFDEDGDGKPDSDENIDKDTVFERTQLNRIIFKPYQDFDGEAVIKYTAYDKDDEYNKGEIIIKVEPVQEIPTLKFTPNYKDEYIKIDFEEKLDELIVNDKPVDIDDLDYVKFELPAKGTLKIKLEGKTLTNVDKNVSYELGEIEYIRYEFVDDIKVNLNYTVYVEKTNIDDKGYDGLFIIDIR